MARLVRPLLSEALNGSRTPCDDSVRRFLTRFREAQAQGMAWPDEVAEEALRVWVFDKQKRLAKDESRVPIQHGKTLVRKATRVGVQKREHVTGEVRHEQLRLDVMTWDQIDQFDEGITTQIIGLAANRTMVAKLRKLREEVPDSLTPGDAAQHLGTTVAEWLAS